MEIFKEFINFFCFFFRLWCHEAYRVFYDRMVDYEDRRTFFKLVKQNCQSHFKVDLVKILFPHVLAGESVVTDEHVRTICFGDFMHPEAEKKVGNFIN